MRVTVKLFSRPIELEMNSSETIRELKTRIERVENISVELQRLVYMGKPLDDDSKTLDEYRVRPDATIYLMIRVFAVASPNKKFEKTSNIKNILV